MSILDDIRQAFRVLKKSPGFALVAIVALALGIGVNTTVFTLVNAVLFRGLPFEDSDRILHLENNNLPRGQDSIGVSYPDFRDWKEATQSFESLEAFTSSSVSVADGGHFAERYSGFYVTAGSLSSVGQQPLTGRNFEAGEDQPGAEPVAILGYAMWKNRYGGDQNILGQVIRIEEIPTTVVGVMPEGMRFPLTADLWLPAVPPEGWQRRDRRFLEVYGKLKEGKTMREARTEMDAIAARLEAEHPETNKGFGVVVKPYNEEFNGGQIRIVFLALMGAVGFVLLIACANVANLLLARSAARKREMSVRAALGAGRWRIVRQLLTESAVLSILGGAAGLAISFWGVRMFDRAVADVGKPYWIQFTLDGTVVAFFAAVCLGTAFLFGLAPALRASKTDLNESLKEGGRGAGGGGSSRLSRSLVAIELALAVVLLVGAGLMVRSALNVYQVQLGMNIDNLLTMRLILPDAKYSDADSRYAFMHDLEQQLDAIPGVKSASISASLPLSRNYATSYEREGQVFEEEERRPSTTLMYIGDDLFSTFGQAMRAGRLFEPQDRSGSRVAIVNERLAETVWPRESPLGQRLKLGGDEDWTTVVGVVSNVRHNGPADPLPDPVVYVPYSQRPITSMFLVARTAVPPDSLIETFRRTVRDADADLPVFDVRSMDEVLSRSSWPYRVFSSLFAAFALIALVLSAVGIYAVVSYGVAQRTQEIGIRMALGARAGRVVRLVVRQAAPQLAIGLALGLLGAFGLSRVLASLLVRITPSDPWTFTGVALILLGASLAACLVPARRASKVDPIQALRME